MAEKLSFAPIGPEDKDYVDAIKKDAGAEIDGVHVADCGCRVYRKKDDGTAPFRVNCLPHETLNLGRSFLAVGQALMSWGQTMGRERAKKEESRIITPIRDYGRGPGHGPGRGPGGIV